MPKECNPKLFEFAPVEGRAVVAGFDGGAMTSNAGALLLEATDRAIGVVRRFVACFWDALVPSRPNLRASAHHISTRCRAVTPALKPDTLVRRSG